MSGTLPVQILLILFFRMTISIYRHLTVAYERSTENMAFSIDGIYDIRQISRDHFANEAKLCGLGVKMALRRFDDMVDKFADALNHATNDLDNLGFHDALSLSHQILDKGGIHHYI